MTGPILVVAMLSVRSAAAFLVPKNLLRVSSNLFSSSSTTFAVESNISRLSTLQTLLSRHGAPGSSQCNKPDDLEPIITLPELVSTLSGPDEMTNLHPYLFPISRSKSSGHLICAYRSPFTEESSKKHPWPIVETKLGGPGFQVLALNSEHLMRRIICECDFFGEDTEIIDIYNDGLGKGMLKDPRLDQVYERGSVEKLGYGCDKYILLRVGPFPDLYQAMSLQHAARNDHQSSLIAAEAANTKMGGFGSTFRFYSRILSTLPDRQEESRDAARMCLRLPLPTIGLYYDNFKEVAILGLIAEASDSDTEAFSKLKEMYYKVHEAEKDDSSSGMTPEQRVIEEANHLIDQAVLDGAKWSDVRMKVGEKYRSIGRDDMAQFVEFFNT